MALSQTTKAASATKKEKVFHPSSRKAGQLARKAIRKGKLGNLVTKRGKKENSLVDFYGFFYHALPEAGTLSLAALHDLVNNVWLARFDEELEQEKATRRKGRPKSAKETKLEEIKLLEAEQYRTGIEVPDLTHPPTVELFRLWDQKELAYTDLLRFIRITRDQPESSVVSRPGKHVSIKGAPVLSVGTQEDQEMVGT